MRLTKNVYMLRKVDIYGAVHFLIVPYSRQLTRYRGLRDEGTNTEGIPDAKLL